MALQIFPEYLKECNQIIFKLIYSNSGQLKQTKKKVQVILGIIFLPGFSLGSNSQPEKLTQTSGTLLGESTMKLGKMGQGGDKIGLLEKSGDTFR